MLEPVVNLQVINPNPEVYYRGAQNALSFFTPQNAPVTYKGLKKEVKALEKIHSQSFIILAHRLKLIRDKELYREDGYEDFKSFIESELDLTRMMIYNYIRVLEVYGVNPGLHEDDIKITSIVRTLPYAEAHPEDKDQLWLKAKELSRRQLESWLKDNYQLAKEEAPSMRKSEKELKEEWATSKEELFSRYKFLRDGMKPKTLKEQAKGIVNYLQLEEPNNPVIQKIIKDIQDL